MELRTPLRKSVVGPMISALSSKNTPEALAKYLNEQKVPLLLLRPFVSGITNKTALFNEQNILDMALSLSPEVWAKSVIIASSTLNESHIRYQLSAAGINTEKPPLKFFISSDGTLVKRVSTMSCFEGGKTILDPLFTVKDSIFTQLVNSEIVLVCGYTDNFGITAGDLTAIARNHSVYTLHIAINPNFSFPR